MHLASTATRVQRSTSDAINARLRTGALEEATAYRHANTATTRRLEALAREWDVERAIELESAVMVGAGAIATLLDRRFAVLPMLVGSMLLLHNIHGWYPMLPVFRRLGLRTTREIADEAYALKRNRGDFQSLADAPPPGAATAAYEAAGLR